MRTTVGIAACRSVLRKGLQSLVSTAAPYEVSWAVSTEEAALERLAQDGVDVLVVDPCDLSSGLHGLLRRVKADFPATAVLLFADTMHEEDLREALRSDARGVISPNCGTEELSLALSRVLAGKRHLCSHALDTVLQYFLRESAPFRQPRLTRREREVLALIAKGMGNQDIADALGIALNTAIKHRAQIMQKTGIHSSPALAAFALRHQAERGHRTTH